MVRIHWPEDNPAIKVGGLRRVGEEGGAGGLDGLLGGNFSIVAEQMMMQISGFRYLLVSPQRTG